MSRDPRSGMDVVNNKRRTANDHTVWTTADVEMMFDRIRQLETALDNVAECLGGAHSYINGNR